ncbi:coiled-coil domain-containing protein 158 isoform X2 [Malaya genurostris]|uniref:coiled-coil domain-containing protein 158 isoform X2 n=1 Tax=Malaya genurostris TaxID=325434 RepID=UPI0026F3FF62|nr:coiled-coil domain-containing protein 158 isoform X2 [Malaya genurostris]
MFNMNLEDSKKFERLSSSDKIDTPLYKKKTFDFTDYAYREAVNRLKFLLTESYEPTKIATSLYTRGVDDIKSEVSDNQSTAERPSIAEVSKYFNPGTVSHYGTGLSGIRKFSYLNRDIGSTIKPATSIASLHPPPSVCSVSQNPDVLQPPPELLGFIEKQESYIEQLEKESQYCREELSTLLKKVKDVVSENEALTDQARSKTLYQLDSSESDELDQERSRSNRQLSGPNIVFESRISELEAQLAQSQIDLKKLFNENEENKRKLAHGSSDSSCADVYRKQVENLQRDKQSLEETVRKLQLTIDQLKDSEANNFNKSQRSRDMIEHVAFERNQAEIEIRRLKDELERQHERVREIQHEMTKRIGEERANAERRYTFQVDQLGGDLSSQWEQATKLQLEVERMKRIESDYKREINQKNSQLDELKLELKNKMSIFMSDLNQASAEKQSLEQEITSLRLQLERTERQSKVEVSRLNAEITSLRQRLDRSDSDLLHSKRENLKLADEVASLEKELTLGELNKETRPSKELAKIISDMEDKHAATVSELEGMVQDQKQLMEKLTAECKSLTHKLEDTTLKHKQEIDILQNSFDYLSQRIETSAIGLTPTNQDNQYASSTNANVNDNRYPTTEYTSPVESYNTYPTTNINATAEVAPNYSNPTPNQFTSRDDTQYEDPNTVSGSASNTNYQSIRSAQPAVQSPPGKVSRPESRTSDRQIISGRQQSELSRNSSVNEYNEPRNSKYTDEKRSESRLSRVSIPNEEGTAKTLGKEPESGRADTERSSRNSGSVSVKQDSAGSTGRLSRESIGSVDRTSRQSTRQPQPATYNEPDKPVQYVSEHAESVGQYQPTSTDQFASQPRNSDQNYQQAAQQYQPSGANYVESSEYDTSQYDPSQQYDQSQYEGYTGDQQYMPETYDQQIYDQQQYQNYQQPYEAQQYTTEQVYDDPKYSSGNTIQSPTQQPVSTPSTTPITSKQTEGNRNVGYTRPRGSTTTTGGSSNGSKQVGQHKQSSNK